jgi:hypothetical protein
MLKFTAMKRFLRAARRASLTFWWRLSPENRRAFKALPLIFIAIAATTLPLHTWILAGIGFTYFAPTIAAAGRDHDSIDGIAVLNLFLGWTLIGWVIAMSWACARPRFRQQA